MALVRIGDRHPELRTQIGDGFVGAFADGSYYPRITQRPVESSEGNMVCALKQVAYSAMEKWGKDL